MKTRAQQRPFRTTGDLSRRDFGKLAALFAGVAALPVLSEQSLAQLSALPGGIPQGAVKIDANENPLGPCKEALDAMATVASQGGRYAYGQTDAFIDALAAAEKVSPAHIKAYAGSSTPLHHAVLAFASAAVPLITAEPGYEAPERAARAIGAKILSVPLLADGSHDLDAMLAAANGKPALFYVCNPNNPTGTATPREQIVRLINQQPAGSIVLVDEAYIHFTSEKPCTDLVAEGKPLLILRTFSKLYGMAGLRAGAAIGRPDLLQKLAHFYYGALPITAMAAATASLKVPTLVEERRRYTAEVREDTLGFLKQRGFAVTPAVSNCFMVDVKRPGNQVVTALRRENVYIGRTWPAWPTHVRVTVGTRQEMELFRNAFAKVTA
jgi:histidinol-phosphate aminotransferase